MNSAKALLALLVFDLSVSAYGQFSQTNNFTNVNLLIPDGDVNGTQDIRNIASDIAYITSMRVRLNLSGNFNGDLYGYLRHSSGATTHISVLLNRPGRTASNTYGYADNGFDVVFDDSAAHDIHTYRDVTTPPAGSPLSGTWQPDARFVDPAIVTATSPRSVFLSKFNGMSAAGDWTLFLADVDRGGTNFLKSWALEITGKTLPLITWNSPEAITYGTALSTTQLNATANMPGIFVYDPPAATVLSASNARPLSVTFTPDNANDYAVATATVTLTVLPHAITITAANTNKVYGSTLAFTGTEFAVAGLLAGDAVNAVTLASIGALPEAAVGSYDIVPSTATGTGLDNYAIEYKAGKLSVGPASLTVSANNQSRAYGATNPEFTGTLTGVQNADTINRRYETPAGTNSPVGEYAITPILADPDGKLSNYTVVTNLGKLTVQQAPLLVRAENISRAYGQTNPPFTATFEGLVNGETTNVLGGALQFHTVANTNSPVGTYAIEPIGLTAANYALTFGSGTLTVTPFELTVSADSQSRPYGAPNPELTGTLTGVQNADNITRRFSTPAGTNSPAGEYPITPTLDDPDGKLSNYTVVSNPGKLTVEPAPLQVKANDASRAYGRINPVFTATFEGLVNSETTNVLGGALEFHTVADTNSPVGTYSIDVAGVTATNYAITFASGTLTVTPFELTVSAENQSRTYGTTNAELKGTWTGVQAGDNITADFYTLADTNSPPGAYPITPVLKDPDGKLANYTVITNLGTLTVQAAPLQVKAGDVRRPYGQPNPPFTATFEGLVNGEGPAVLGGTVEFHTTADVNSPLGEYPIQPGGLAATNYAINFVNGTLTITSYELIVTANNQSRTYGASNPDLTGTCTVNADNITATFSTTATASSPVGTYLISPVFHDPDGKLSNYTVITNLGTLTVEPTPLVLTASDTSRGYGQPNPELHVSVQGVQNSDNITVIGQTTAYPGSPVGTYAITPLLIDPDGKRGNYNVVTNPGTLTVTRVVLLVRANDVRRAYGRQNPPFTATFDGLANGEGPSVLSGTLVFQTSADVNSLAGTYSIVPSGLTSMNYDVLFVTGTLTVTPYELIVSADNQSRAYGATNPPLTGTLTGVQPGHNITNTFYVSAGTNSPVGSYPITPVLFDPDGNLIKYTVVTNIGILTVQKAALVVRAVDASRAYGQSNPAFTATFEGWVNGESTEVLDGTLQFHTTADTSSPIGVYPIDPAGVTASNYAVTFASGTLTVTPSELTVNINNQSRTYGASNPGLTGMLTGLQNADNITATYQTSAKVSSPVGGYPITPAAFIDPGGRLGNYSLRTNVGMLTIQPAALTVKAKDAARAYGQANPSFTATFDGFVNGEDPKVLGGTLEFHTYAGTTTPVGTYPIEPIGLTAANYAPTFASGILTVTPFELTVSAYNYSRAYGATNPELKGTLTGVQNADNITRRFSTPADTKSPPGEYPITPTLDDPDGKLSNYTVVSHPGKLTVELASLQVKANDASRAYGQTNPPFTAAFEGLVNGEDTNVLAGALEFHTVAGTNSPVGTYSIDVAGVTATNYAVTFVSGTLTVRPFGLTVSAYNQSRAYGATNPPLTGLLVGVQNGDNITATNQTLAETNSPVGTYPITPVLSDPDGKLSNYTVVTNLGTLTVQPAALLVRANNVSRAYAAANPPFTATFEGLVNREGTNVLTGTLEFHTLANTDSMVGDYAVEPGGLSATNYAITFANGTLTVTPVELTVTIDNQSRAYGTANPSFTGTVSQNADNITASYQTTADMTSPVGAYPITPVFNDPKAKLSNYTPVVTKGILTVTKAPSLATLKSSANPVAPGSSVSFTVNVSAVAPGIGMPTGTVQFKADGGLLGDPLPLVNGHASVSTAALTAGEHSIAAEYTGDDNFLGAQGVLSPPQVIDRPPVAVNDVIGRIPALGTRVPVTFLLSNDSDPEGGALTFDKVEPTSTAGGTVSVADGWVLYTPPPGFTNDDSFLYTVRDAGGGSASATVTVLALAGRGISPRLLISDLGTGRFRIESLGKPWGSYTIQAAEDLLHPDWRTIAMGTADPFGSLVVEDTVPSGRPCRWYRAVYEGDGTISQPFAVRLSSSANPAVPGSTVTLTIKLTGMGPGNDTPSGTVQFKIDGVNYGEALTLVGGSASVSTATLALGAHSVVAEYSGDANFRATTCLLESPQVINTPPVAVPDVFQRDPIYGMKLLVSDLLANDSDPDGGLLTFDGVTGGPSEGGSVRLAEGWLFYTPADGSVTADSFTYRVRDALGGTATATVEILPSVGNEPSANLTVVDSGGGTYRINFSGIPWRAYYIQYTENMGRPDWQTLATRTADSQGRFRYDDTLPAGTLSRYYRSISQYGGVRASPFRLAAWTNYIAHTNGRAMQMWSERTHPAGWPNTPPVLKWNTNSLIYGFDGFTGISQCNEFEGAPGQVPVTLLTRRHAYTRGHGMGQTGALGTQFAGKKVWFCTVDNTVVQMTIAAELVRSDYVDGNFYDYGLFVFTEDVPEGIHPVYAISPADMEIYYYWDTPDLPYLFFGPEQAGYCSANVPPFVAVIGKAGDSGAPNMIPSPDNKLIMFSGRTTSGFSLQMQADIDALSIHSGLNTNNYQLRWYDLSPWEP